MALGLRNLVAGLRSVTRAPVLRGVVNGGTPIVLDYPCDGARRRSATAPYPALLPLFAAARARGVDHLRRWNALRGALARIPAAPTPGRPEPAWHNTFFPGLDAISLYGALAERRPSLYLEIGSGNSTLFARRAVTDGGLPTRVVSVDPSPRAQVDAICDHVVRAPLERADLSVFDRLGPGDVLFFDGSHRCFQNSDVTVFFLEVLPRVPAGCLVGIHDVFLPADYPAGWGPRYYSEQFVLAAYLLGDAGRSVQIEFASAYAGHAGDAEAYLRETWAALPPGTQRTGGCFWFTRRE